MTSGFAAGARAELPRVAPESVGVPAGALERLMCELERITDPHSIMIARDGKVCCEAWWQPYSPAVPHMLASHSKGYSATAIGILVTQGKLSVDDLVCELLSEYMPDVIPENLKKMRVRHLLTMTSGMTTLPDITLPDWERDFFRCEMTHEPGSTFFYSGNFTAMLCVIVRKVAGCDVKEFLTRELFNKIGIDPETIKWMTHADGLEYGGGGMITITENNLRLGLLYMNGGVWQGERILSEEWVEQALGAQFLFRGAHSKDLGYGYQTWLGQPHNAPRFDGAGGQYTIMYRDRGLTISITESGSFNVNDVVLDAVERFCDEVSDGSLPEDPEADASLMRRIATLAAPRTLAVKPVSARAGELCGRTWEFPSNRLTFYPVVWGKLTALMRFGLDKLRFERGEGDGEMLLRLEFAGEEQLLHVSFDGLARLSRLNVPHDLPEWVYAYGAWSSESMLELRVHVVEAASTVAFTLELSGDAGELAIITQQPNMLTHSMDTETIRSL